MKIMKAITWAGVLGVSAMLVPQPSLVGEGVAPGGAVAGFDFFSVTPCRAVRSSLLTGFLENVPVVNVCGVSPTAKAVSFTVSEFSPSFFGLLQIKPAGVTLPAELIPTIKFQAGQNRSAHFILAPGTGGAIQVLAGLAGGAVGFTLDIDGYFE